MRRNKRNSFGQRGKQIGVENALQKYSEVYIFTNCQDELLEILTFFPLVFFLHYFELSENNEMVVQTFQESLQ